MSCSALWRACSLVGYLVLLRFGMNFWQLFLILIPAEAVVYFSFHIRAKH